MVYLMSHEGLRYMRETSPEPSVRNGGLVENSDLVECVYYSLYLSGTRCALPAGQHFHAQASQNGLNYKKKSHQNFMVSSLLWNGVLSMFVQIQLRLIFYPDRLRHRVAKKLKMIGIIITWDLVFIVSCALHHAETEWRGMFGLDHIHYLILIYI